MSSSAPDVPEGNNVAQPLFTPRSGGDITLRSRDGVNFRAHSAILKFASSVFDAMIATGAQKDTIQLTEDAIGISHLLKFIYPNSLPLVIDFDALPICLAVVQKYEVAGAIEIIDQLITFDNPPYKPLSSDPIRVHELAVRFNLVKTRAAAAQLIMADGVDFCDLNKAPELAQKYSSLGLLRLMNIQAMRAKLLSDVLFGFDHPPILPAVSSFSTLSNIYYALSCSKCQEVANGQGFYRKIPPSWVLAWTRLVYETLLNSSGPLAKSDHLFHSEILEKFKGREDVCQTCLSDYHKQVYSHQRSKFDDWAQEIKEVIEAQLVKLELVYTL